MIWNCFRRFRHPRFDVKMSTAALAFPDIGSPRHDSLVDRCPRVERFCRVCGCCRMLGWYRRCGDRVPELELSFRRITGFKQADPYRNENDLAGRATRTSIAPQSCYRSTNLDYFRLVFISLS